MLELEKFIGKTVNIICKDGDQFIGVFVDDYSDASENFDRKDESIDILKAPGARSGVTLYKSEIKSIEILD